MTLTHINLNFHLKRFILSHNLSYFGYLKFTLFSQPDIEEQEI